MDLESCVRAALTALGGDKRLLPGARVSAVAIRLGAEDKFDFREALRASGKSFSAAIKPMVDSGEVVLVPRRGSDFLLGFSTAPIAEVPNTSTAIRRDFFLAFTRIRDKDAYYHVDTDEILFDGAQTQEGVIIPRPSAEEAWQLRTDFAESLEPSPVRDELIGITRGPVRYFSKYTTALRAHDLAGGWARFQYLALREKITKWAAAQNIPIRDEWFSSTVAAPQRLGAAGKPPRESFLGLLTQEELARVLVPADIVQALIGRHSKR
jgi:hypothetical protein